MKKVLVIGGTGTISTPIVNKLAEDSNVNLYVLNRGNNNNKLPKNVTSLICDIRGDVNTIKQKIGNLFFDSVINFTIMDIEDAQKNVEIFKDKCNQFIFISTNVALDHANEVCVDEKMRYFNQFSTYGYKKAICEQYFLRNFQSGFPVTIVRPTQTYSDGRIPLSVKGKTYWSVCSRMIKGKEVIVHGDGQSIWAMTHANDFANFFVPLVGDKSSIGEIYQIMNPEPMTWDMIYQGIADELGVEYKPVYISTYLLDHSKYYNFKESIHGDKHFSNLFNVNKITQKNPGVKFTINRKEGIRRFVEYMRAHPNERIEDKEFDKWCDETIDLYHKIEDMFIKNV